MLPFERLRALARFDAPDQELVIDAADCLADFGTDPMHLVTVCRQLLAHHPAWGPLWWLCARVLVAPEPAAAALAAARELRTDPTPGRLADALPFSAEAPIATLGWPEVVAAGLDQRPDLEVLAIRTRHTDSATRARMRGAGPSVRVVNMAEAMAAEPSHLLIEPDAADATSAVVTQGTTEARHALECSAHWLVLGIGRVLPERLFEELRRRVDPHSSSDYVVVDTAGYVVAIGPAGRCGIEQLRRQVDCPVAPELLGT